MQTLYVMCGISGSGKSTWANKFAQDNFDTLVVSTDGIRGILFGDASVQRAGKLVFDIAHKMIDECIEAGYNVVFDATNLHARDRKKLIEEYHDRVQMCCVLCAPPVNVCVKRQEKRSRKVPEQVIRSQAAKLSFPMPEEGWDRIICVDHKEA